MAEMQGLKKKKAGLPGFDIWARGATPAVIGGDQLPVATKTVTTDRQEDFPARMFGLRIS
jgi:hypothetical protein